MSGPSTLQKRRRVTVTPRVLVAEVGDRGLCVDDVALQLCSRRVGPAHVLREEGRVVSAGAVVVRRALEDELAHGRVLARAGRKDVERPHHVVLVREARGRTRGVHDEPRVDDGVDLGGADDPPQQRVLVRDPDELGALELLGRVL